MHGPSAGLLRGLERTFRSFPACTSARRASRGLHHLVYRLWTTRGEALAGYRELVEVTRLADGGVRVVDKRTRDFRRRARGGKRSALEIVMTTLPPAASSPASRRGLRRLHRRRHLLVNALSTRDRTFEIRLAGTAITCGRNLRSRAPLGPVAAGRGYDQTVRRTTVLAGLKRSSSRTECPSRPSPGGAETDFQHRGPPHLADLRAARQGRLKTTGTTPLAPSVGPAVFKAPHVVYSTIPGASRLLLALT